MGFISEQLFGRSQLPTGVDLTARTVIVTGANTGLGLQTALHLARLSPGRLILAVRNTDKGKLAAAMVEEVTLFKGVEVWELDLGSFDSVKSFAARCAALDRLDILVENAGIATEEWVVTKDGWESTLQVNVLSTGLLALLVLPILAKTALLPGNTFKPHLAIVGSEVHFWATFAEKDAPGSTLTALNTQSLHVAKDRYNVSKLLDVFLAHQIAALPLASGVVVNVINPGLCVSELRREMGGVIAFILNMLARTSEDGAKNIAWAATTDTSATPGAYVSVSSVKETSAWSRSAQGLETEAKVWGEMRELWLGLAPELSEVL